MDARVYLAKALCRSATQAWNEHKSLDDAEPLLARLNARVKANLHCSSEHDSINLTHSEGLSEPVDQQTSSVDRKYLAQVLVNELHTQQTLTLASEAENNYHVVKSADCPLPEDVIDQHTVITNQNDNPLVVTMPTNETEAIDIAMAEVNELLSQRSMSQACDAEARFIEVKHIRDQSHEMEDQPEEHVVIETDHIEPLHLIDQSVQPQVHLVTSSEVSTNTDLVEMRSVSCGTDPGPTLREIGCNTIVSCYDVLRRAKEVEELEMLKAEHILVVRQFNEQKSQRMVAEQLTKIVQSDLSNLRQKNVSEMTTRMRLENDLSDTKAELTYTTKQMEDKEQRITELEDSLKGTSILIRKLEEQNAVSLMNRGGMDYMLQAKLAEGRAREAEQRLEVVQSELLQSQGEVRVLLERVGETSRDKSEMVSNKVHNQLLQLADDRAMGAERQVQGLQREVRLLKDKLTSVESPNHGDGYSQSALGGGMSYSSMFSPVTMYNPLAPSTLLGTTSIAMTTTSFTNGSSLYSSSLGSTNQKLGYLSHDSLGAARDYMSSSVPSHDYFGKSLSADPKSHDYLGKSHVADPKSYDYLGKSHVAEPKSYDYLGKYHGAEPKSHDYLEKSLGAEPKSHDYLGKSQAKSPDLPPVESSTSVPIVKALKNDSDSSWSSSEDEDTDPLAPSSHRSLIAEWEWRAMNKEDEPPGLTSCKEGEFVGLTNTKRKPPPIAPKPKLFSSPRDSADTVSFEPSSTFNEPVRDPLLNSLTQSFKRSRGPRGRRLPTRGQV